MKKALSFNFEKAVGRVLKEYPYLARNAFFMHAGTGECLTSSPLFRKLVDNDDKVVTSAIADMEIAKKKKTSFAYTDKSETGDEVHIIIFHPDQEPLFSPRPGVIDDAGSFDHEIGHILAPDMQGRRGENLADSYALIRHLQRTDGRMPDADYCGWRRAVNFVTTGAGTHLTTFSVDRILIDQKTADFVSLSPRKTAAIARAYAMHHTPSQKEIDKAADDFKSVCGKVFNQKSCKQIAKITLKAAPDSATFYLGARILSALWQTGGREIDGKTIELRGAEWHALRAKIETRMPQAMKAAVLKTA